MFFGLEDRLQPIQRLEPDSREIWSAVINRLLGNCVQNPIRDSARPRDLQEVTTSFSQNKKPPLMSMNPAFAVVTSFSGCLDLILNSKLCQ
tara:strand:- start:221 stop:493 length:273 start_codon:yes stop_codon:yes gene_type:complete